MTELLTFGVTYILRSLFTLMTNHQEVRKEELAMMRRVNELEAEATKDIRAKTERVSLFGVTSSILAIMGFFAIVVLPKLVPLFFPGVDVYMAYEQLSRGFLFFTSDAMQMHFETIRGVIITPLDTHLASAIAGLYFGSLSSSIRR